MRIYIANPEVASAIKGEHSTVIAVRDESGQVVELVFTSTPVLLNFSSDLAVGIRAARTNPGELTLVNRPKKPAPQDALHAAGLLVSPFPAPMFAPSIGQTSKAPDKPSRQPRKPTAPRHP